MFAMKRVYDPPAESDGYRVLVDRLWPRGMTKERAAVDLWLKDVAPSPGLRTWFNHEARRFDEFRERYLRELEDLREPLDRLRQLEREHGTVTLVYAARDTVHNHPSVILEALARSS